MEPGPASQRKACAIRTAASNDQRRALSAYLDRLTGAETVEFAPKDDDELDAALCAGRFERVVFADLDALLTVIWKGHGHVDRWVAAGVRIELAAPPADVHGDYERFVAAMYDSLARWRKRRRRQGVIAAIILSVLALAALAALFCLVPVATN